MAKREKIEFQGAAPGQPRRGVQGKRLAKCELSKSQFSQLAGSGWLSPHLACFVGLSVVQWSLLTFLDSAHFISIAASEASPCLTGRRLLGSSLIIDRIKAVALLGRSKKHYALEWTFRRSFYKFSRHRSAYRSGLGQLRFTKHAGFKAETLSTAQGPQQTPALTDRTTFHSQCPATHVCLLDNWFFRFDRQRELFGCD